MPEGAERLRRRLAGLVPSAAGSPTELLAALSRCFPPEWGPICQALALREREADPSLIQALSGWDDSFLGRPLFTVPPLETPRAPWITRHNPSCLPAPGSEGFRFVPLELAGRELGYWVLAPLRRGLADEELAPAAPLVSLCLDHFRLRYERERRLSELEETDRLAGLGRLVAGVVHELRAPLQSIISLAELEARRNAQDSEFAARMLEAGLRCRDIVDGVLPQSRRSRDAEREAVDPHACVLDALELDSYSKDGELEMIIEEGETPEVIVHRRRLVQVLLNLLTNARQALRDHSGSRRVRIVLDTLSLSESRLKASESGRVVRIAISDRGPGVPEALRSQLFESFVTGRPDSGGTGLGLAISRELVEAENGVLYLDESHAPGARFVVEFPAFVPPRSESTPTAWRPEATGLEILTVDDDPELLETYAAILALDDHRTTGAHDLKQALSALENHRFDVVITDLRLPDGRGLDLLDHLRRNAPELAERVILATGDAARQASRDAIEKAGVTLLLKPFQIEDLTRAIADVVNGR